MNLFSEWRDTSQILAPVNHFPATNDHYNLYPGFPIGPNKILSGYDALATLLARERQVILDGYGGVFWENFRTQLNSSLLQLGVRAAWMNIANAFRPVEEIERLVADFIDGDDPLFGTLFTGEMQDFVDPERLRPLRPDPDVDLSVLYGCGAALAEWDGLLVYIDVPKNEIQFRSRAGAICNLGSIEPTDSKAMYKRFYFVDWVVLNRHKSRLLERLDLIVDEQHPNEPIIMAGNDLRRALTQMSCNYFRARPWFEPGPWGGQWIKRHIPQLPQDVPNYAWSFELITPENGLMLESDNRLLEVSFDFLMFQENEAVLGEAASRFGHNFPIRFDFLDSFDGGNLSVQCHPRPDYIRRHFGEGFTQDETYYILDCASNAHVYLGFCDEVDPLLFRDALEQSAANAVPIDIERFVQAIPANKHDLFLIPHGTVHCSGVNNLVLEISATPYIFTFKMYDWLRLGLDGQPRPLNIQRAFENLNFERQGRRIQAELISKPYKLKGGRKWSLIHLPTHHDHFYDVHRFEFKDTVESTTDDACKFMNLVELKSIILETEDGMRRRFHYAETFVVPAGARSYRLINEGQAIAKVVKAFVKHGKGGIAAR